MSHISILHKIEEMIRTTGGLPENFEPEEREYAENELRFAPGAMEGILGHHSANSGEESGFAQKLQGYLQVTTDKAMELFEKELTKDFKMASIRNALLQEIIDHQEAYPAGKVANLGYYFAANATKCETVKLGLSLLALFNFSENEKVCHVLKNLGYCEEFTDYVLMNTGDWEEQKKQDFYFELAKKLHGWGKIDVVEMMEADTEEKKQWILCHGCKNSVLYAYLGYECAIKCDLYARLERGNLTREELQGAGDIMEGLIDEGPCAGISILEKPVELTMLFVKELKKHALGIEDVGLLDRINSYFKDSDIERAEVVCVRIKELMDTLDMDKLVRENLKEHTHQALQIARNCQLDVSAQLLELMQADFEKYYTYSYYLFSKESFVEEFFVLCDKEIDASRYPRKMGDSLGLGKLGEGILSLDMIVQNLDKYPLKGKKLLEISIQSPITRWRNMAGRAMVGWTERLKKPLSKIDEELYNMVLAVAEVECNTTTKEYWEKLSKEF